MRRAFGAAAMVSLACAGGASSGGGPDAASSANPPVDAGGGGAFRLDAPYSEPVPDAQRCVAHADCPPRSYCADGQCLVNDPGGPCSTDDNCPDGERCARERCACGSTVVTGAYVAPNVLIALDRSLSMRCEIGGTSKWDTAVSSLVTLMIDTEGLVRYGVTFFPSSSARRCATFCGGGGGGFRSCPPVGSVAVAPADGTLAAISATMGATMACGAGTPIAEALGALVGYPGLGDPTRGNFVLLVTDGAATCDDPVTQVMALRARTPEVKTIVVGFGSETDPAQLSAMGAAGGAGGSAGMSYYLAEDAASLTAILSAIGASLRPCVYQLDDVPPDPTQLYVFLGDMRVDRDPTGMDGWDYSSDTNSVTFAGSTCDAVRSGSAGTVTVVYGCPSLPLQ